MPAISCDYSTDARACAAVTKTLRLVGSRRVRRLLHVGGGAAIVRVAAGLVRIPAVCCLDGVISQRAESDTKRRSIGSNNPDNLTVVGKGDIAGERSAAAGDDVGRDIQLLPEENRSAGDEQSSGCSCLIDVLRKYRRSGASVEIGIAAVNRGDGMRAGKQRGSSD